LVDRIAGQVAAHQEGVELPLDREPRQLVERAQLVLAIGIHRVHEVVLVELTACEAFAQPGEREVICSRHSLVVVGRQKLPAPATSVERATTQMPLVTRTRPTVSLASAQPSAATCSWKSRTPMATPTAGSTTLRNGSEDVSGPAWYAP